MRIKALFVFLAVQLVIFASWQKLNASNPEKEQRPKLPMMASGTHPANPSSGSLSSIRFSAKGVSESYGPVDPVRKQEILDILKKLPEGQVETLKTLILDYSPEAHRGLGGKNLVILRAVNISPEEFAAVMIHELGHSADLGYLNAKDEKGVSEFRDFRTPIYTKDPSLDFYRINWENENVRKEDAANEDFVSGYAMTDPFEDFAETYAYYVLHNRDFQAKAKTSGAMMKKYEFMKNIAFGGKVYNTGSNIEAKPSQRPWDVTLLPYNLNEFLGN